MLFFFAQQPHSSAEIVTGGHRPACVYLGLLFYFGTGLLFLLAVLRGIARWRRDRERIMVPYQTFQFVIWTGLLVGGLILILIGCVGYGMIAILIGQLLPRIKRVKQFDNRMDSKTK